MNEKEEMEIGKPNTTLKRISQILTYDIVFMVGVNVGLLCALVVKVVNLP